MFLLAGLLGMSTPTTCFFCEYLSRIFEMSIHTFGKLVFENIIILCMENVFHSCSCYPQIEVALVMFIPHTRVFTAHKRSLGQGNIFIGVCQEFCSQGEGVSAPGVCLLQGDVCSVGMSAPGEGVSGPGGVCLLLGGVYSRGVCLPGGGGCLLPGGGWWRPPGTATAVGGLHPTGMYSCFLFCIRLVK